MNHYDPSKFERKIAAVQTRGSGALPELTVRDEANALVAGAIRNQALFEDLHAGRWDPVLDDPTVSRISDAEMKQLMIRFSAALAWLLDLRDHDRADYARQIAFFSRYASNWEREATSVEADLPRPRE